MAQMFFTSHFQLPKKNQVWRFSEVAFPTPQAGGRASLQPSLQEATELKTRIVELENAIKQLETEKAGLRKALLKEKRPFLNSGKTFSELNASRKCHRKDEVLTWLKSQGDKLPRDWKIKEVSVA